MLFCNPQVKKKKNPEDKLVRVIGKKIQFLATLIQGGDVSFLTENCVSELSFDTHIYILHKHAFVNPAVNAFLGSRVKSPVRFLFQDKSAFLCRVLQ